MSSDAFLLINQDSSVAPYEQIELQLRTLIASGQLRPGDKLPSVRQLGNDLGVAPNTVMRAYKELERDGWVVTSLGRRASVAEHPPILSEQEQRQKLAEAVQQLLIAAHQLGVSLDDIYTEIERQVKIQL